MQYELNATTGLLYDPDNLGETIRWVRSHNAVMQQQQPEAVEALLWQRVAAKIGGAGDESFRKIERVLEECLAAHWIVDKAHRLGFDPAGPSYMINFFVRPGRQVALRSV